MANRKHTKYSAYVGTDSGILKGITTNKQTDQVKWKNFRVPKETEMQANNGITALAWRSRTLKEIYVGCQNSTVHLFDTDTESFIFSKTLEHGTGKVAGIIPLKRNVLVGLESGQIDNMYKTKKENPTLNDSKKPLINTMIGTNKVFHRHKPTLEVVKQHPVHDTMFATGGCENDLKLWDITGKRKLTYSARNVENDTLNLRVPVWVSDLTFMEDNRNIAVVSRHSYVRLYDPRAQRRPVMKKTFEKFALTSVASVPDRPGVVVLGSSNGRVAVFDVRGRPKESTHCVFKGISGAVKDVAVSPSQPHMAHSVSLDRYLRLHNIQTKETIYKEYLRSRLTRILLP